MSTIVIDIETIPAIHLPPEERGAGAKIPARPERKTPPSNWRDPAKIAAKQADLDVAHAAAIVAWEAECAAARDEAFRKGSLKSTEGRILCVAWAIDDGPVSAVCAPYPDGCDHDERERYMLAELEDALAGHPRPLHGSTWVGHNVGGFDLRWLMHRAWKYRLGALASLIPYRKWDRRVADTMAIWQGPDPRGYARLDEVARFLGVGAKTEGIDGSRVYDAWLAGDIGKIVEYCAHDVELTREVYRIIKQ